MLFSTASGWPHFRQQSISSSSSGSSKADASEEAPPDFSAGGFWLGLCGICGAGWLIFWPGACGWLPCSGFCGFLVMLLVLLALSRLLYHGLIKSLTVMAGLDPVPEISVISSTELARMTWT